MNTPAVGARPPWKQTLPAIVILTLGVLLSYGNSFRVPFLFDDGPAIVENTSIRDLGNLGDVLWPSLEGGVTTGGRPVLNLSFALNHALNGYDVRGYHVVNLAIHLAASLALFGIVRRTIPAVTGQGAQGGKATLVAAGVAALWALHPLQTSAVTYLAQRAESLCGMLMLIALMTFIRSTESTKPRVWLVLSATACALGMATKEVMAAAPILILAFDRTFVAGSFANALKHRPGYYLALAATWGVLAALMIGSTGRGTTAGFETIVGPWNYLLTQAYAIIHYLALTFWPSPLVFDYGTRVVRTLGEVWPQAALLLLLAAATVWALLRKPLMGFWAFWFFAILAPSSSFVPVASQTIAEHRMYLPLAAVLVLAASAVWRVVGSAALTTSILGIAAVGLAVTTRSRNEDFQTSRTIWADTVEKAPGNTRAHINLAVELLAQADESAALVELDRALDADPRSADAHFNKGVILAKRGEPSSAALEYQKAIESYPRHARALNNLGTILQARGELAGAESCFSKAIASRPGYIEAHGNLSAVLLDRGMATESLRESEVALRINPSWAEGEFRKGNALLALGRLTEAKAAFERCVAIEPANADAQNNLGNLLVESGDLSSALSHYRVAIQHRAGMVEARRNAGFVLVHLGRIPEAIEQFEALVRLRPNDEEFRSRLEELRKLQP